MNGYFSARVIGAVVDEKTHERFIKKLPDGVTSADAIAWFIKQIADGSLKIEKLEGKKCD